MKNVFQSLLIFFLFVAVVIEKSFLKDDGHYKNVVTKITDTINGVINKWMKVGGIDVKVYSLSRFTLGRGNLLIIIARRN